MSILAVVLPFAMVLAGFLLQLCVCGCLVYVPPQFVAEMAPVTVSCARAEALGLPANPPLKEIVKHYIDDFLGDDFVPAR